MVQSVLGAKNLEQGQLGVNFIGWLKILSLPLFILTGVLCYELFPHLKDPSEAYMTMVTSLFPAGHEGLGYRGAHCGAGGHHQLVAQLAEHRVYDGCVRPQHQPKRH